MIIELKAKAKKYLWPGEIYTCKVCSYHAPWSNRLLWGMRAVSLAGNVITITLAIWLVLHEEWVLVGCNALVGSYWFVVFIAYLRLRPRPAYKVNDDGTVTWAGETAIH